MKKLFPSSRIFKEDTKNSKEVKFECDQTKCTFKFTVYKYAGKHHPPESKFITSDGYNSVPMLKLNGCLLFPLSIQ